MMNLDSILHMPARLTTMYRLAAPCGALRPNEGLWAVLSVMSLVFSSPFSKVSRLAALLAGTLVGRTLLSVWIATLNGSVVKSMVDRDHRGFFVKLLVLALYSLPASFINSAIPFLTRTLSLKIRESLTKHFVGQYLNSRVFYKLSNIDTRLPDPEHRLTQDVEKWSTSATKLFSSILKPLIDIVILAKKLSQDLGAKAPSAIILWYCLSAGVMRALSPPFSRLSQSELKLEGQYRSVHNAIVSHSEEIAFLRGYDFERQRVSDAFSGLMKHARWMNVSRFFMSCVSNSMMKYAAMILGYGVIATPAFAPQPPIPIKTSNTAHSRQRVSFCKYRLPCARRQKPPHIPTEPFNVKRKDIGSTKVSSNITQNYVKHSSLLINLAKAIGRLITSYSDVQSFIGQSYRVDELNSTMVQIQRESETLNPTKQPQAEESTDDLCTDTENSFLATTRRSTSVMRRGDRIENYGPVVALGKFLSHKDKIEFQNVPICTPQGEVLVSNLSFTLPRGQHLMILGPNGSGKSSILRVLGELWPHWQGRIYKPATSNAAVCYVAQKPYMPEGTLREQITYPDKESSSNRSLLDEELGHLLVMVHLKYVLDRSHNGWDTWCKWEEELSGGEKQRLAFARLFYHHPDFAILDEATSAVSVDIEGSLYKKCHTAGISLVTVSHRVSLLKHHDFLLKLNGQGNWTFERIDRGIEIQSFSDLMALNDLCQ